MATLLRQVASNTGFRALAPHTFRTTVCSSPFASVRRSFASDGDSRVIEVTDDKHVRSELASADGLVVIDFTAKWCGPCRKVAPHFDELSKEFQDVKFLKADIDNEELGITLRLHSVQAVPTFSFVKDEQLVSQLKGANVEGLKKAIAALTKQK
eukprot:CAMPEP_0197850310 /NCGR_PEP_ID=MMETSP1438-20131217/14984_1 /TAXON_ID=1461541 /ORGANISM="Pterosperma sp., Strain CCMP1384" /LENGTH=153 /DNA_ID=CAMNT_0043463417 /DNA_START=119 /DNA_END=580 /DNA_ORIENTATION=+